MITVHHLEYSQSFRIVWLLEEMGMDYNLKVYKRMPDITAPSEYQKISPLGTAPVVTDGDPVLSESNAIIDYILDQAPTRSDLRPEAGDANRAEYLFWYHAAQGTLQSFLSIDSLMRIIPTRVPWPISMIAKMISKTTNEQRIGPKLHNYLGLAEKQLSKTEYFAGRTLTAADITSIYPMHSVLERYPEFQTTYPNCQAWLQRVSQREAFQRAQKAVGEKQVSLSV